MKWLIEINLYCPQYKNQNCSRKHQSNKQSNKTFSNKNKNSNKNVSEKSLRNFNVPLHPFHCAKNYKKIFKSRSRVLRKQHFRANNNPFTLSKIFFAKTTNINFLCLLTPFIVQN